MARKSTCEPGSGTLVTMRETLLPKLLPKLLSGELSTYFKT